jgi:hypothetical protein
MQSPDIIESWRDQVCQEIKTRWVGVKCLWGNVIDVNLTNNVWGGRLSSQLYLLPHLISFECQNCSMSGKTFLPCRKATGTPLFASCRATSCSIDPRQGGIKNDAGFPLLLRLLWPSAALRTDMGT